MLLGAAKRVLVGRPMQSEHLGHTLLPKKIALPVFASDALSSVAYATEEILLVLALGGIALFSYTPWIAAAVGLLMLVVVTSYRQNVHAYPSGGGDYEVATTNLGPKVGLTVASALMVDYTLTVAVSVSAGVANLASAYPVLAPHVTLIAVLVVAAIALLNLRGTRESGTAFAIPTYFFIGTVALLIIWGVIRVVTGGQLVSESTGVQVTNHHNYTGLLLVFLLLKAFSSGCTALTGVEAISNGVPAFRKPKSKNAATTLALLGGIAVAMFAGVTALALISHVHVCPPGEHCTGLVSGQQRTVIAQVGRAVFGHSSPLFYLLQLVTALILVLAANTAFNGFPVLASILSRDGYLPRQLHTRGDRLAFSNGILLLSGFAILLIVAFNASPTRLIQLYIIGVFVSFVCSQTGMIRHWNRLLKVTTDPKARQHMMRIRVINTVGACFTAVVLVIVLATKFLSGAWIVVVAMPVIWMTMRGIRRHYDNVAQELTPPQDTSGITLPSSNRAVVLVSKLHLPTLRALAYARATQPSHLEAVTVSVDDAETERLRQEWERAGIPVPLTIVASPYREITRPVVGYIKRIRRESPRDVVTVFVPEYVLGHWWEQVLHNQSALRLKTRLLLLPGVIVASVPYQLRSASKAAEAEHHAWTAAGHVPAHGAHGLHVHDPHGPGAHAGAAQQGSHERGAGRHPDGEHADGAREPAAAQSLDAGPPAEDREPAAGQSPDGGTVGSDAAAGPAEGARETAAPEHHPGLLRRLLAGRESLHAEELQAQVTEAHAKPIADCADRERTVVTGALRAVTVRPRGQSMTMEADLWDGSGSVTLVWLGRRGIPGIEPGRRLIARGRIATHHGTRTIYNPMYELQPGPGDEADEAEPSQANR
jgi:amino acid transporter